MKRTGWVPRTPKKTGPSLLVRTRVLVRADGRCEFAECGAAASCIHHRFERGSGGVGPKSPAATWINQAANLLAACNHHNDWVSNQHPEEAYDIGWLIHRGGFGVGPELPWEVPVVTWHDPLPVYLDNEGKWTEFHHKPH